jgi:NAD(P)H-flavin reductase
MTTVPTATPDRASDPMRPRPVRVTRVARETSDTVTVRLETPEAGAFAPGQFNMVYLFGAGEVPLSLSGDPARPGESIHTIRAVGSVTRPMTRLRRGAVLGLRGPFGNGWPIARAEGRDVVIVAGGIGLAPLRPVIYHVLRHRQRFGRLAILYGTRTPDDLLYTRELERWRGRTDVDLRLIVDRPGRGWRGEVGVVTSLVTTARFDPGDAVAMVCGPEVMMRFAARELIKAGLAPASIHLSIERNMKCGLGWCGHCQLGPVFICTDGPVLPLDRIGRLLGRREV